MKVHFQFKGKQFLVPNEAFIKKSGCVIRLPDDKLVKIENWIRSSDGIELVVLEVEVIKAEVIE